MKALVYGSSLLFWAVVVIALAGCGGGGGDSFAYPDKPVCATTYVKLGGGEAPCLPEEK